LSEKDIKTDYLQELMRMDIETLSLEEERALGLKIAKGDSKALEKLVKHNLRFVPYVLKKGTYWQHGKTPVEDVIGIGNEMLIIAAKRWKPMGNIRFSAFARSFIIRGVQRELDNTSNIIRLPINIMEGVKRMNYNEQALTQVIGRKPTHQELATVMNVPVSKIHQLKGFLSREPVSLDSLNLEKHSEENEE
jgi:DNA-directed RNA polymerase sigma subunit (sigma70/sigma32)